MSKLIYLEPDEEITDVIDKISKVDEKSVSLVIPRGSTLANSIVNLKLLAKRGKSLKKDVAIVTNDNIAHNLASQIGMSVFGSIEDARTGEINEPQPAGKPPASFTGKDIGEVDGVKVHQYDRADEGSSEEDMEEQMPESASQSEKNLEPEVIEAVKDEDEEEMNEALADEQKENSVSKDQHAETKDEFKLTKRPMKDENHFESENLTHGGKELFGKVRDKKRKKKIILWSAIGGALVLALVLVYAIIPKAVAKIAVVAEPFSTEADLTVSKDATAIDNGSSTIPGKYLSQEDELAKPFAPSGSKNIGETAKGKITVYNNWDQQPVSLPAGSKFQTSNGVEFASVTAVSIPGAQVGLQNGQFVIISSGKIDVDVSASTVGESSNIGPSDFTITTLPKVQQSKIYGKSSAAMTGGTNKLVKVVTDKDLTDAKASTEKEILDSLKEKIKSDLADNDKLLDSAISSSVSSEGADKKVGDQVDTFNFTVKMKVEAITFSEKDFQDLLLENARGKIASDKQIVPNNENQSLNYEVKTADIPKGTVGLKGTFAGFIASKYDETAIKSSIKGKTINTARSKISALPGVLSVDFDITPSFLRNLPFISSRISIQYIYGNK